ncbi:uncharacterized protein LOC133299310 [Gastrolobium bilobum]|uniref:uncharacterized protein LOC133299310 n=1 Tax=Gastrolobium bilobum TaxID=150636 RepID=UPI002AAFFF47|nr:uncharacterized protein LOC133299310 [Gastrolobium bilobum]
MKHSATHRVRLSMGFNDKRYDADGIDPDCGAIFMSNEATKKECFQRRLFGLPSSDIQFVEQVKAGMILFLFEYEERQLYGVFKATCDGAMNIVPNAYASSRKQFPAQVKFVRIWRCKPLEECLFRDAIIENYFSAKKFNFGLSENQVYKLLYLFSTRKLELEVPGRRILTRTEELESEWYPVGEVGRSVDRGMHVESDQDEQGVGVNISPIIMHKYQGDSLQYNGDAEYIRLDASDIVVNKQGRAPELVLGTSSECVSDYLALKDESGFTEHEKEHYMDTHLRPNIIDEYSKSLCDKIRVHGDGRLSISDRLKSEDLRNTDQRMVFLDGIPGLHDSNVNPTVFYSKPNFEHNSLVQNQLRRNFAMNHQIQAQILNNSCATQGDVSSKTTFLYDQDAPRLNFSQSSAARINNGSELIIESSSPSNNRGGKGLSSQPRLMHTELKDMNRMHDVGGGFLNSVFYGSNRYCMSLNAAQNSDRLEAESDVYEPCNSIRFLKSSSATIPPTDIGNSGRVDEPVSSLFHNYKSCLGNNVHSIALGENLSQEMTLQKNNRTVTPIVPRPNESHSQFQYGDSLILEHDIGCYGDSQNNNSCYPKKKSSVFSRLSFTQDVNNQENGNNAWNEEYDFHTVDAVMEMVHQSRKQGMTKRKPKPLGIRKNAESLRKKTQSSSVRMKGDCFENTLEDLNVDLTNAIGGNTNETAEEICFVDFKRRSKVRKLDETEITSSNECEKSENLVLVQQKKRKLIRPNFSKSTTSDDKGIGLGAFQNLQVPLTQGSFNLKDVSESCCALVQTEDNIKTDAEVQNINVQTHSEDKSNSHAKEYVCSEGGEKATDDALTAFNDESECLENLNNQNVFSSASCKDKNCYIKEGLCMMDSTKSVSLDKESFHSIGEEHHVDGITCAGRGINTEEEFPKDCGSFSVEVKDGSDSLQNSSNDDAPIEISYEKKMA